MWCSHMAHVNYLINSLVNLVGILYQIDSYPTWYCLLRKIHLKDKIHYNFKGPSTFVTFNNITKSFLILLIHLGIYRNYQ